MRTLARSHLLLLLQLGLLLTLAGLTVVGTAKPAFACSCSDRQLPEIVKDSPAVLTGVPVKVTTGDELAYNDSTVTVNVTRVYKGDVPRKLYVKTSGNGASCGWMPEVGVETAIFLYEEENGDYSTNLCSGNQQLTSQLTERLVKLAGAGKVPESGVLGDAPAEGLIGSDRPGALVASFFAVLTLLVTGGVVLAMRRSRKA